jgi:hypothetical protein
LQGSVADGGKIHQYYAPMRLLQGDCGIDGGGGGTSPAFGVQKSENAGLAGAALRSTQRGGEASEGFDQGFAAGGMIQKLTGTCSHGGDDVRGLAHLAHGKNRDVRNAGVNQFDGADSALRILGVNAYQDDFSPLILQLPQYGIARTDGEAHMAEHGAGQIGALDATVQNYGLFAIFGKKGDSDPGHDSILSVHCHATNFQHRGQVTFVTEGDGQGCWRVSKSRETAARLLVSLIVRQRPALEKMGAKRR